MRGRNHAAEYCSSAYFACFSSWSGRNICLANLSSAVVDVEVILLPFTYSFPYHSALLSRKSMHHPCPSFSYRRRKNTSETFSFLWEESHHALHEACYAAFAGLESERRAFPPPLKCVLSILLHHKIRTLIQVLKYPATLCQDLLPSLVSNRAQTGNYLHRERWFLECRATLAQKTHLVFIDLHASWAWH